MNDEQLKQMKKMEALITEMIRSGAMDLIRDRCYNPDTAQDFITAVDGLVDDYARKK